jgi:thiol-disulfide isomerase/thioredoxin
MNARLVTFASVLAFTLPALGQSALTGTWEGYSEIHGQKVPVKLELKQESNGVKGAFLSGPERWEATSGSVTDGNLVLSFDYFARKVDGTVKGDDLTGTFGTATTKYPLALHRGVTAKPTVAKGPDIHGDWEIAVGTSTKGESAWNMKVEQTPTLVKGAILRIDGDTGGLYGNYDAEAKQYVLSHFTAAGPALYFSFPDLNGKTVSSKDPEFKDKVVLVAIGGSWCPNCHDEAPLLESLYKKFHNKGLEVVSLTFEQDEDQLKNPVRVKAFIKRYNVTYPVLLAGTTDQLNEKITGAENLNCWPTSFFVDREGKVREIHAGFSGPATGKAHEELVKETTDLVEKLLAEKSQTLKASN